ncbi:MAG: CotH kinase family protein [Muribaculaceae bacterium]|nr:CotH kinase family protein [Muribaculaceae bacterium]
MKSRFLHTVFLCLLPLMAWGQSFDEMAAAMNELSLPLVNLEVEIDSVNKYNYTLGSMTLIEYKDGIVKLDTFNCQVKYRGGSALLFSKKPFNIKLVDDEGEKLDANLLGLRTDNTWILDAMGIDKLRMRNRVCFDIWNEFSHTMWNTNYGNRNGTVGTMVEVFINGDYHGIYCLSDKINRQLLNLRKAKVEDDGSVTVKGLLYKGVAWSALTGYYGGNTNSVTWDAFELQYPEDYPSLKTWQPLITLMDFNCETEMEYFIEHYNEWYYVDNLVDYWVFLIALGLTDQPYKNTFLSTPDINFEHRFMITPWDLDACLGRAWNGNLLGEYPSVTRLDNMGPYRRLKVNNIDGFKQKLAQRWQQLIENELSPANLESHINAIAQRFVESGAWQREYNKWKNTNVRIAENIEEEVQFVINWYIGNLAYANENIEVWSEGYDPLSHVDISTVTSIYNYLLGIDATFYERLDLNQDGIINTTDVTIAYNVLLEQ